MDTLYLLQIVKHVTGGYKVTKTEDQLMVRVNVTLPLAVARELRKRVPEKQRSKLITTLLEKYFEE